MTRTSHPTTESRTHGVEPDAGTPSVSFLQARARSLREQAARCIEPLAVAYRRRAAELELLAAVRAGTVQLATVPVGRTRPYPLRGA